MWQHPAALGEHLGALPAGRLRDLGKLRPDLGTELGITFWQFDIDRSQPVRHRQAGHAPPPPLRRAEQSP